jgi:hypothetical protein
MQSSADGSQSRSRGKGPLLALLFVVFIALIALIAFQLRARGKLGKPSPSEGAAPRQYTELMQRLETAVKEVEKKTAPEEPLKVTETLASRPKPPPERPQQPVGTDAVETTTQEPAPVPPKPVELTLKGVVLNSRMPLAMINDAVLGKDEAIEGFKVLSIEKDRVVLEDAQGNRRTLTMFNE